MYVLAVVGNLGFFIQAYNIFQYKTTEGISLTAFISFMFCQVCWIIHGLIQKDKQVALANTLAFIGTTLIVLGIIFVG